MFRLHILNPHLLLVVSILWNASIFAAPNGSDRQKRTIEITHSILINQHIQDGWTDLDLVPSAQATDFEFCRRVFLDVVGRIPTVSELFEFRADRSPDKKKNLVSRLLYDERYRAEYARHWSTVWLNILIGRESGNDRNRMVSREGLRAYLNDAFAKNLPYDRFVFELLSATGENLPSAENFNGAVNYLAGKLGDKAAQATAHSSRVFLGVQVQCTQCHDHPFNEWKQSQYWQMNSFFRQTVALRRFEGGNRVRMVELADQDFGGEDRPRQTDEARIYYELRNGKLEAAIPVFLDGTKINPSGYLGESNRRLQLARLITNSDYLGKAIVNRMWAQFFGYGFTKPIDDMGPHNIPSHPDLLDYLGTEFQKHSYDLKSLISWIVLSEPYSLSSRMNSENEGDDPQLGVKPSFSHFYIRQMTAEQLYESLITCTQADKTRGKAEKQIEAREKWLRQFTIAFGTDEGDDTTTFNGTIPQTLMMFNGDLMKKATSGDSGSFVYKVAHDNKLKYQKKVARLYFSALARSPSKQERRVAISLLKARAGNMTEALQDLWWALLNSNEFIINH